jgi:hypothetical protein
VTTAAAVPYYQSAFETGQTWGRSANWLDYRHPDWEKNWIKWRYARDVYTGEVLDPQNLGSYLIRKGTGETLPAYYERQGLADFTSHFGLCADALAGMLFNVEDDATRIFGALGASEEPSSFIGALYRDADGKKTGYATLWKQLGIEFVITHCHWLIVETTPNNAPRVKLIEPERVVDWVEDQSGLAMVKVCEQVDTRATLESDPNTVEQYVVFTRDGWQRYRSEKAKGARKATVVPVGNPGTYNYVDATGQRQLSIFRVVLPLRRNVGYPLAKKNVAIFNKESERDHLLRTANFPKLIVPASDDVFAAISKQVADGSFLLQDDPNSTKTMAFAAPPTASVEVATRVLEQKVEQFYKTFFREYADTAQEKTATEIRQDVASGVGAFLQMLKAGLDDAENEALWRLEQAVFPNDSSKWFTARVERSANFQPLNVDETIERLRNRYLGQTKRVPLGRKGLIEVLRQISAYDGIPFDDKEAGAVVDQFELMETSDLLDKSLPVPDAAKATIVIRWLKRLGIVTAENEAALLAAAEKIAGEDAALRGLLAQPLGPPTVSPDDPPPVSPAGGKKKQLRLTKDPKTGEKIVTQEEAP